MVPTDNTRPEATVQFWLPSDVIKPSTGVVLMAVELTVMPLVPSEKALVPVSMS